MSILKSEIRVPRFAEETLRRARLSVVPDRVEEARRAPFVALVVLLLGGGVAGLLAFNTSMQQASFHATALENRADALTAKKQALSMQLAAKRDPQALAARAKALGMVVPTDPAFIRLTDGTILGQPTAATPDDSMRINPAPAVKPEVLAPKPRVVKVPAATPAAVTPSASPSTVEKKPHRQKKGHSIQ
ncbi:cell division protein FtsL [Nocardioides mangrovicus]|uniref:Cell division protein FtsL n=1 Tax=Nocardioides mangrovicus TaxID=2478913 RepID=A0A3L8P0J0_9ACTN|nr:cell division protein FtsL [Nocardioides mangrovicus]RLV48956.1 cell division protein FtsL [Nocardioides mangrovicus]